MSNHNVITKKLILDFFQIQDSKLSGSKAQDSGEFMLPFQRLQSQSYLRAAARLNGNKMHDQHDTIERAGLR